MVIIKKRLSLLVLVWCCSTVSFGQGLNTTQQKFIQKIFGAATIANHQLKESRNKLLTLYREHMRGQKLSSKDSGWLESLSEKYKVNATDFAQPDAWQKLLLRVDEIPPSLVIAQAINESAWGKSRFAKQGNNYFGKWCFVKGCGIVPLQRAPGASHEVKKYSTVFASVNDYMLNINTNTAYKKLRLIRKKERQEKEVLKGEELASGLDKYSEKGEEYVRLVEGIINRFNLTHYDLS